MDDFHKKHATTLCQHLMRFCVLSTQAQTVFNKNLIHIYLTQSYD